MARHKPAIERFNERCGVPHLVTGCIEWIGNRRPDGYGRMHINGMDTAAHRAAWMLFRGEIPEAMFVCHHCDNPGCVNVEHLYIGTPQDNMDDMVRRGRDAAKKYPDKWPRILQKMHSVTKVHKGDLNPNARITATDAAAIRASKEMTKVLVERYGVTRQTIQSIRRGDTWNDN